MTAKKDKPGYRKNTTEPHPLFGGNPAQYAADAACRPESDDESGTLRCPTCNSPQPSMHPATAEGGEVCHICPDQFHLPIPEGAWRPEPTPAAMAQQGRWTRK